MIAVIVATVASSVNAQDIKCYACSGSGSSSCGDAFDVTKNVNNTCIGKSCTKLKTSAIGVEAIVRGCGLTASNGCKKDYVGSAYAETCTCTKELCNSATEPGNSGALLAAFTAVAAAIVLAAGRRVQC